MKRNYLVLFFIAGVISSSACMAQNTAAVPEKFNYKFDLKKEGTSTKKIAGIDSLLQSFVDQKKVSSVVGFIAKDGNVVYQKAFGWKDIENQVLLLEGGLL